MILRGYYIYDLCDDVKPIGWLVVNFYHHNFIGLSVDGGL